ncbi:hypothetical protein ACH5RR_019919 [Cinchona calisaya]|uniref:AIPP2-like SPOC-like domain-containing protein n=1 Tax=Cinchona calisaya TaxID=153742 RepID=A0ABD2ZTU8_9GENT
MGSKVDECSGEASAENGSSFSVNDAVPNVKVMTCKIVQKSETRNFRGVSTGTSKDVVEAIRNSDMPASSENISVFPKVEDLKGQDDHDHYRSCVTGAEDTKLSNFIVRNADGLVETASDVAYLVKAQGNLSLPASDKSPLGDPSPDDMLDNSLECPIGHLTSLSMKVVTSGPIDSDPAVDTVDYVEKNEGSDKVVGSRSMPDDNENCVESHPMDEHDDADMVEHDVKVCDICGDAGREDLLAICCRCSDGAEHTYCMREMVDKVPGGDWLCEECKFNVEMKNLRQEKVCSFDGSGKINSFGKENPEFANLFTKYEDKGSDVVGNRTGNDPLSEKLLGKRHSDDAEVSCTAKKRVLEPDICSAKVPTSSGIGVISRDSSFKHLGGGKAKPSQHSSAGTLSAHDIATSPASGSRLHTPQGTFTKSNSFNSLNVKPKVKLVDDFVPQRQRSVRGSAFLDKKEGASRSISKSMSFRITNSGRQNIGESKVKMLSPKFSHIQEIKGSKHSKDRNIFERKNSFKSGRISVSAPMANPGALAAKNDQKLVSFGEPNLHSSARNFHDVKAIQSESRSMILSKSSSFAARIGSELPVSLGEFKGQSSTSAFGVSSLNENSGHDMKPNQGNIKEDSSSSSYDGSSRASRPKESMNFGERAKDSIWSQSRQSSTLSGKILSCRKCKEIGHLAQFCTADHPGSPASDATAAKNPRETVEGKDKLKAAIEAAVLRKPSIYRKHWVSDQSDDASLSNINSEIATQDKLLDSNNRGNVLASGEMQEGQIMLENSTTDGIKQENVDDNGKQLPVLSVEGSTPGTGGAFPVVPLERLSLVRDVPSGSPAASTLLKTLAIPDNECIWQGVFEVNRVGKTLNLFDGIQAYLSTCASPKVLEAVNKFARKVLLNEVPRLTMWPVQFQEYGVQEDNVALFFFAKDLASYEKSYKVLLDNMMKYDLALKGSFDGFEIMIFPSNQLPEKSQRWNALFFLWGVFRGRRPDCSNVPYSNKQTFISQGSSKSLTSEVEVSEIPCLVPSQTLKQGCDGRVSSEVTNNDPVLSVVEQDNKLDSSSFSVERNSIAKSCGETVQTNILCDEMRQTSTSPEDGVYSDHKIEQELYASVESTQGVGCFSKSQQTLMDQNFHISRQYASHHFGESPAYAGGIGSVGNLVEGDIVDKMSSSQYHVSLEDGSSNEASSCVIGDQIVKDNYRNRLFVDSVQRIAQAAYASRGQVKSGIAVEDISVDEVRRSKKQKTDVCQLHGANDQTSCSIEGLVSQIRGVPSRSPFQTSGDDEAFVGADVLEIKRNTERYFFAVDPDLGKDVGLVGKFMPWKMSPSEQDQLQDRAPNLELALGAESKPMTQGTPAFSVGKEDRKIVQDHCRNEAATKGDEDDVSASLSLSLSFPFPDVDQTRKSLSNSEQLMPERQRVNTSLLLFEGLKEK